MWLLWSPCPCWQYFMLTRYILSALQFMVTDLWDAKPCVLVHGYQFLGGKFSLLLQGRLSRFPEDEGSRTLEKPALTRSTLLKASNLKLTVICTSTSTQFISSSSARAGKASACKERDSDVTQRM